jgi:hypothetical protein
VNRSGRHEHGGQNSKGIDRPPPLSARGWSLLLAIRDLHRPFPAPPPAEPVRRAYPGARGSLRGAAAGWWSVEKASNPKRKEEEGGRGRRRESGSRDGRAHASLALKSVESTTPWPLSTCTRLDRDRPSHLVWASPIHSIASVGPSSIPCSLLYINRSVVHPTAGGVQARAPAAASVAVLTTTWSPRRGYGPRTGGTRGARRVTLPSGRQP